MKNWKRWVLALGIAAGVIGGAGGVAATTAEEVATGYTIASHDKDDESPDDEKRKAGETDTRDDKSKSGDSSDKADDDASDANDTDGPGDDEDD